MVADAILSKLGHRRQGVVGHALTLHPAPDALAAFLADALLSQHAASLQLYEELQSCANLPLVDEVNQAVPAALDAWQSMVARQLELQAQTLQLDEAQREAQALQTKLDKTEALAQQKQTLVDQLESAYQHAEQLAQQRQELLAEQTRLRASETQQQEQRLTELDATRAALEARQGEAAAENELLLNQLHQVQEELERYYLEAQQLKQKLKPAKPPEPVYYGAGQRIRQQLSYKLGATMIERSRSAGGWFSMPVELLRVARQHKRELPLRQAQKLPPISKYRDAHEAERYRNHLSYRLGQALLKNVRSPIGWVRLPFAIRGEVRDFRLRQQQG